MLKDVLDYIDENADNIIRDIKRLCQIPSLAAKNEGLFEAAQLVRTMLVRSGVEARLYPTKGAPVLTAQRNVGAKRTLLFYDHYDVQPAEPLHEWESSPFDLEEREGRIYGRGVADNKGDIVSRIWVLRAFQKTATPLPVNVKFLIEGEEEISSPHLPDFIQTNTDFLKADGGIWEFGSATPDGTQEAWLGLKGILYVQLEVDLLSHDAHSSTACILPAAPYRLVWALNSLKDQLEHVQIEGFYDDVKPLTKVEKKAIDKVDLREEQKLEYYGLEGFVRGLTGADLKEAYYNAPTCNICGLISGYQGDGSMTVLPAKATAKVDFRLVEEQKPEDILDKLRAHLDSHGFPDVKIAWHEGYPAAKTPVNHRFVEIVKQATQQVFDHEPLIHPTSPGSGPLYLFKDYCPMVSVGVGDHDSRAHAPNESVALDTFFKATRRIAVIMDLMGKW